MPKETAKHIAERDEANHEQLALIFDRLKETCGQRGRQGCWGMQTVRLDWENGWIVQVIVTCEEKHKQNGKVT